MKKNKLLEYVKEHHKILLLAAISLILFNKYIVLITFLILLGILGMMSMKITSIVPHISIETVSASAVLFGFVWDWKIGLIFGLVFGMYGYIKLSIIKLKTILNAVLMGVCGIMGGVFASMGYSFRIAFILTFVVRIVLNNIIFPLVESDMFENLVHGFGDPLFNILITGQFMQLFYTLIVYLGA